MSYKWENEVRLDVLKVEGQDSKLFFKTDKEEAEVYLDGQDIGRVVHRHDGVETIISNENSHHVVVGKGNEERDVFHYLKPNGPAPELRLGITKHRGVGALSILPHNFELNLEPGFEESFFHLISGKNKSAIQLSESIWQRNTTIEELGQLIIIRLALLCAIILWCVSRQLQSAMCGSTSKKIEIK